MPRLRRRLGAARLSLVRLRLRVTPAQLVPFVWHNPLVDADWYLTRYPDVGQQGADPARHYRRHGVKEARDPNAFFDTRWYLARNPDVAASGMDPLDHYYLYGAADGRDPSPRFDTDWYLAQNPDVRASGINPLLHYLRHGAREGRASTARSTAGPAADRQPARGARSDVAPWSRLLLVVHDGANYGAQRLALHMAKTLRQRFNVRLDIVMLLDGELRPEFEQYGQVHIFRDDSAGSNDQTKLLRRLRSEGVTETICNTTISGRLAAELASLGYRVVTLVHELPGLISDYGLESTAREIGRHSEVVIFPSETVRDGFESIAGPLGTRAQVRPQGMYRKPELPVDRQVARVELRRHLELANDTLIVLAVGWSDLRKGFDLFHRVFAQVAAARSDVAFVWVGCEDASAITWYMRDARMLGLEGAIRLLPRVSDLARYYSAADVFLLPSREDPFPSVVIESLSYSLPIVAFEEATGLASLLGRGCGVLVPYANAGAMSAAVVQLLDDVALRTTMGTAGARIVADEFDWSDYVHYLLGHTGRAPRRVSVIVPNYNYARYLELRLESIFKQSYPILEVIVLDDASTDDSITVLQHLRAEKGWDVEIVANTTNSGSVFRQWLRGAERARGDLVWIAEADDFAEPEFLSRTVGAFEDDKDVVLAYTESRQVDAMGLVLFDDYLQYVADIDPTKWTRSWVRSGVDEVADTLAIRNTIPNVSGVLFDRSRLLSVLQQKIDAISSYSVAGDYAVYVNLLLDGGRIAFVAERLNNHRRHERGLTQIAYGPGIVREIARVQTLVRRTTAVRTEIQEHARRYLEELCVQFDLPSDFLLELDQEAAAGGQEARLIALHGDAASRSIAARAVDAPP